MKTIRSLLAILLISFSVIALADKVVITGDPVVLEKRGQVYYVPSSSVATTVSGQPMYYTVDSTKRVCYMEEQPGLAKLNLLFIKVNVGGSDKELKCYEYSPDYFTVTH